MTGKSYTFIFQKSLIHKFPLNIPHSRIVKRNYQPYSIILLSAVVLSTAISCSTNKNTSQSRWWHAFNTRYNTYYNGAQAYIDGSLEKENGNKDNFTELIPLYTVGNKASKEIGQGNFERAITKAEKAIARHSIKRRPEWNKSRRKTERDIEWLSRREYNPFLWKAWLLMGRAQFHKGAFDEAASTFAYMSRLYQGQPAIYGKARAWLAKSYIEEGWLYDAEDVIRNMQRDSLDWHAVKEWDYTLADYYIHTGDLEKAIPYMQKVVKHEMRRKQRARELYLLAQLYAATGKKQEAQKTFRRVVRSNPPYELEFNARIAETEVMAAGQGRQMVAKLKRMAASDNNKEYLDQVYYAMGNIYLAEKDTMSAISAYEQGNKKATRNGIEKGVLLLHLGDLYWAKEKFGDARRCYNEALGLLDKDRKDYEQLSQRSKVLDELVPFTDAVQLQDSLQHLAKCTEKERFEAIDKVIEALKRKEKEERDKQAEQNAQEQQQKNGGLGNLPQNNNQRQSNQQGGAWYFYNPMAVQQGKTAFQQQWGKRENIDNWQRINKTVVGNIGSNAETAELTDEQRDSIAQTEARLDSIKNTTDSAQNDPHKREYYLAQIPFTPEQLEASNLILEDGLHHSGVIFKDQLDNLTLAERALRRVSDNYPTYEKMDDVFYHLYLLYMRRNQPDIANNYIEKLKTAYPKSELTLLLTDPYYAQNAKYGVHLEDSLYAATYEAFRANRFGEVAANSSISETRFPMGANRDKFLFIGGLSKLNNGDINGCVADMKTVVEKYPQSRISEMAGMIVNGVKAGKKLRNGRFDLDDVWSYRANVLNDSDSIKQMKFSPDRIADFKFLLLYHPDSLQENKLLFEMARFNFSSFLVRNFDMTIEDVGGLHQLLISGFRSFDEAYQYARQLFSTPSVVAQLDKSVRGIIISEKNLQLIGTAFSYNDYDDFYSKHFAPLKVTQRYLLSEPAEVATPRERDLQKEIEDRNPTERDRNLQEQKQAESTVETIIPMDDEKTIETEKPSGKQINPVDSIESKATPANTKQENPQPTPTPQTSQKEEPTTPTDNNALEIPAEETPKAVENTDVIPIDEPAKQPVEDKDFIPLDEPKTQPATPKKPATKQQSPTQEKPSTSPTDGKKPTPDNGKKKPVPTPQNHQQPEKPKPATPAKKSDEPIFYFGDETAPQPTPQKKKQKPVLDNVDDEYYDLDGF